MVYGYISGNSGLSMFWSNFKWEPKLVDGDIHLSQIWVPASMGVFFLFRSPLVGIFSAAYPAPRHTHLPYPRTHGHTAGVHCGCSTGQSPDTLLWLQHLPGGGSLHCSCIQPWSPLCTLCQTPFHSWGPQEAHRKELAEEKNVWACLLQDGVLRTFFFIFSSPLRPWYKDSKD